MAAVVAPCKVYVYDTSLHGVDSFYPRSYWSRAAHWETGAFSTELHLQHALLADNGHAVGSRGGRAFAGQGGARQHPWRVSNPAEADVIFIAANFSQMCAVGNEWSARRFFNRILKSADGPWRSASMARVPKVVSLQYRQNCRLPWADPAGGPPKLPRDTLVLTDQLNCKSPDLGHRRHCCGCETSNELTAPFAITRPRWLVRGRVPQRTPPWAHRKLLFFGGHVPTVYNDALRYLLWRQLRRDPRVTTQSHTIHCTIGQFAVCRQKDQSWRTPANPNSSDFEFYRTYCHASCGGPLRKATAATDKLALMRTATLPLVNWSCIGMSVGSALEGSKRLARRCRSIDKYDINFEAERDDYQRDTLRSGSRAQYLAAASRHRFCLIAQGDPGNTAKIVESLVLGGAGGCIPVFVLYQAARPQSLPHERDFARDYPFVRWLDYCSVAFFVTRGQAVHNFSAVLDWLSRISPAEAEVKLKALQMIRPAFVFSSAGKAKANVAVAINESSVTRAAGTAGSARGPAAGTTPPPLAEEDDDDDDGSCR